MACLYAIYAGQNDPCGYIGLYDKGGLDPEDIDDIVAYVNNNLQRETPGAICECVNDICEDLAAQYNWGEFYVLPEEEDVYNYGFGDYEPRDLYLW